MGLSGRKVKQKIGHDPRNLSWVDDAARFGSNYLSKFGWDSSKGLGVSGEGRTSHIKVAQKLDMMGIGAGHQEDPNGIAWKQNKDFENLLKRLNGANGTGEEGQAGIVVDGFVKPTGSDDDEGNRPRDDEGKKENREKKDKKSRKKEKEDTTGEKKKKKRKRDEDAEDTDKKSRKKKKKSDDQPASEPDLPAEVAELASSSPDSTPTIEQNPRRVVPRHRSHRARHIAAKSLSSKSALAISEVLGIAPTPLLSSSSTPSGTQTPQEGKLTSIYDDTPDADKITTSTKSLQAYFKEKIGKLKGQPSSVAGTRQQSETAEADYDDVPRGGLGSRPKTVSDKRNAPRIGLADFSSFMAATSLTLMRDTAKTKDPPPKNDGPPEVEKVQDEERRRKKERKAPSAAKRESG